MFLCRRNQGRGEFLVYSEEMLDPLAVAFKRLWTITEASRAVQLGVSLDKGGQHRQRVAEVCETGVRKFFSREQHPLRVRRRPGHRFPSARNLRLLCDSGSQRRTGADFDTDWALVGGGQRRNLLLPQVSANCLLLVHSGYS